MRAGAPHNRGVKREREREGGEAIVEKGMGALGAGGGMLVR